MRKEENGMLSCWEKMGMGFPPLDNPIVDTLDVEWSPPAPQTLSTDAEFFFVLTCHSYILINQAHINSGEIYSNLPSGNW